MNDQVLVMRGSLQEFCLPDVLQVVGGSRQHTVIELRSNDGKRRGTITIKAGQVLSAEHGAHQGKSAFFELFARSPDLFHVFRMPDSSVYPAPLGSLSKMLFEAADQALPVAEAAPVAETGPTDVDAAPLPVAPAPAVARGPHVVGRSRHERPTRPPPSPAPRALSTPIVVGIASPKGGVGKTTITLNLALSLAERGLRTVIVDADINGDILSAIDARDRATIGAFDLLDRPNDVPGALRRTAVDRLRILPAAGPSAELAVLQRPDLPAVWRRLLGKVGSTCDITLVDCPAGMFQTTEAVLRSCTHVVGVFQAEILSSRSFSMFLRGLASLPAGQSPALAGVVVNMFQGRADASMEAFHRICNEGECYRLFDTTIPRSEAFGQATLAGQPLRVAARTRGDDASPIAWLFDMLADEVCQRLGVRRPGAAPGAAFLS
jgi:cellulose biosynthesis protein BcsQ